MATRKKDNVLNKLPWASIPTPVIQSAIRNFVHFSAKAINSNALPAGIRLAHSEKLDLPYVAVRTIGPVAVPLDYVANVGKIATIAKNLDAVLQNRVYELYGGVTEDDIVIYRDRAAEAATHYEVGFDTIGKRPRQIIVQDEDGNDIALTPLVSAGLATVLNKRIEEEIAASDESTYRYRQRGYLDIGGANTQNVGRHANSLKRPLWFSAPKIDENMRLAFSLHYQGVRFTVPPIVLREFDDWQRWARNEGGNAFKKNLAYRTIESRFVKQLAEDFAGHVQRARNLLVQTRDSLPDHELLSSGMAKEMRALIDPNDRYPGWKRDTAMRLHLAILDQKFRACDGTFRTIGVGAHESDHWVSIIEEVVK